MPRNLSLKIFASETSKVTTISDGGLFLDVSSIQMFDANGAAVTDSSVVVTVGVSADGVAYQSKVVSSDSSLGGFDLKYIKLSASGHTTAASVVVNLKVCGIDEAMSDRQYKRRLAELFTVKPCSVANLPDPASLPVGQVVIVNGEPLASNGQFFGRYIKKPALPKSDGVLLYDAAITFGANAVITSSSGAFTQNDIGKRVAFYEKASGAAARCGNGNIVSVISSTTVVTDMTVSGSTNVTTAAVAYGSASGAYINSYLQSVKRHGGADVPNSIYLCETKILLPNGVSLEGNGRKGGFDLPHNANLLGANVFVCATSAYQADGTSFFDIGDGGDAEFAYLSGGGTRLVGINVDGMLQASSVVKGVAAACKMISSQALRNHASYGRAIKAVGGMTIDDCVAVSHYNGTPIEVDSVGDVHIKNGGAFGAGNGKFSLKLSNCADVDVTGIHLWKCSNDATMLGGQVLIETYGGGKSKNVRVENSTFDTSFGPHVKIAIGNGSTTYNTIISGNQGFNNDAVPAATYPCVEVAGPSSGGGYIRGLSINGNGFDSSFSDETKGTYTGFLSLTGAGTVGLRSAVVGLNVANNAASGYLNGFAPNVTGSNAFTPIGSGTTTTF